jgi:hypothetical protein
MKHGLCFLLLISTLSLYAQDQYPETIADNSFLIEEAFNQDFRVVQHMVNFIVTRPAHDYEFIFTQEWPLFSHEHQISYSIPYSWLNKNTVNGIGDISVNYRYQLFDTDKWAAVSPRLSLLLPTGKENKELGNGVIGYQFNLPVSKRISADWIVHVNAGGTFLSKVKSGTYKKNLFSYNAGTGLFWLWKKNVNFLLEWVSTFDDEISNTGKIKNRPTHIINPGVRFAFDINAIQIVPGFCVPIQVNGKDKSRSAFLYFSAEHPF